MIDAQLRDSYLNVMGVPTWYPRFVLPNAPELDWPVLIPKDMPKEELKEMSLPELSSLSEIDTEGLGKEVLLETANSLDKLKSLMSTDVLKSHALDSIEMLGDVDSQSSSEDHSIVKASVSDTLVPAFGFLFLRYELGFSVIIEIDSAYILSAMENRFIINILHYLGISEVAEFSHRVDWPMIKNNKSFQTESFFQEAMHALFDKQAVNVGVENFLIFGDTASSYLEPVLKQNLVKAEKPKVFKFPHLQQVLFSADDKRSLMAALSCLVGESDE